VKGLKASFWGVILGGVLFAVLSFIFNGLSENNIHLAIILGCFTGLLAAPVISPESYKYPKVVQILSGAGGGLSLGFIFHAPLIYLVLSFVLGAVVGYFAKSFIDVIQVP